VVPSIWPKSGTVTLLGPLFVDPYQCAGDYLLIEATIYDNAGNATDYYADQVPSIFKNYRFSFTNRYSDSTPPVIKSGKIITPSVSLSSAHPFIDVSITGSDDLSGIYFASMEFLDPDTGNEISVSGYSPAPLLSGTFHVGENVATRSVPLGT
jgi:hypothetical protein